MHLQTKCLDRISVFNCFLYFFSDVIIEIKIIN